MPTRVNAILGLSDHVSAPGVAELLAPLLVDERPEVRWAARLVLYGCTHFPAVSAVLAEAKEHPNREIRRMAREMGRA